MANPYKYTRLPIAAHGVHGHKFQYPTLMTCNFFDITPITFQPLLKEESLDFISSMFSRLEAVKNAAFITGRIKYRSYYVPYRTIWRPYHNTEQGLPFVMSNGLAVNNGQYPTFSMQYLNKFFVTDTNLVSAGTSTDHDFYAYDDTLNPPDYKWIKLTMLGTRVYRILGGLGYTPTFTKDDKTSLNAFALLSYFRIWCDQLFPRQYVGNTFYNRIAKQFTNETVNYDIQEGLALLKYLTRGVYDSSIFDSAWDQPVSGNQLNGLESLYVIPDITQLDRSNVDNATQINSVPVVQNFPDPDFQNGTNNTPVIANPVSQHGFTSGEFYGRITKYLLDQLTNLSNFCRRHQIAGGRLIDRFLVSRGVKLSPVIANECYFNGEKSYEIMIDAVENNTSTDLGELAGKGIAESKDDFIKFSFDNVDDDGIAMVLCCPVPDAEVPVFVDPYNMYVKQLDTWKPEFDKAGVEPVPMKSILHTHLGNTNEFQVDTCFGFLNRYYGHVTPRPRLLGDYTLMTRGARELESEHTFRLFDPVKINAEQGIFHGYDYLIANDADQYQRLFHSANADNIKIFNRWWVNYKSYKLPLGDSYDWDDDEFNRTVQVVTNGERR